MILARKIKLKLNLLDQATTSIPDVDPTPFANFNLMEFEFESYWIMTIDDIIRVSLAYILNLVLTFFMFLKVYYNHMLLLLSLV